ncbi:rhodanese-like domain-containing protein [candidate division KSB1 bacterium]|nr:rhodanese-like domain-containing protein [candidate division KSB1 bacterium]
MTTAFLNSLKQAIWISVVAATLGICYNGFSKHGIPFILESKEVAKAPVDDPADSTIISREPLIINLEQTYQLFQGQSSLFIDARDSKDYELGHLPGARNIPWLNPDEISMPTNISKNQLIVIYCSDLGCEKSIEMAFYLYEKGFIQVRIFQGGWEEWKKAGYPREKGKTNEN